MATLAGWQLLLPFKVTIFLKVMFCYVFRLFFPFPDIDQNLALFTYVDRGKVGRKLGGHLEFYKGQWTQSFPAFCSTDDSANVKAHQFGTGGSNFVYVYRGETMNMYKLHEAKQLTRLSFQRRQLCNAPLLRTARV